MRSAKAPTINAGVMMAKVIWNITNTLSGTVSVRLAGVMPLKNALDKPPTKEFRLVTPCSMPVVSNAML